MGLSVDTIEGLSGNVWGHEDDWFDQHAVEQQGLDIEDKHLRKVLQLTKEYMGFPRQLGQHTGGFVITKGKLSDLCPILNARMENRTCIEWNKDDIDELGFMKIDVLALGMLTCIRKGFDLAILFHAQMLSFSRRFMPPLICLGNGSSCHFRPMFAHALRAWVSGYLCRTAAPAPRVSVGRVHLRS